MNSVKEWDYYEGYVKTARVLKEFKVSSEDAERGVPLVAHYPGLSKKEGLLQNYLQVVEDHKKRVPDIRKSARKRTHDT